MREMDQGIRLYKIEKELFQIWAGQTPQNQSVEVLGICQF